MNKNITLILPVAGKSSRFKNQIPKWLLSSPNNNLMISESIKFLNLDNVKQIVVICLKEHINKYIDLNSIKNYIKNVLKKNIPIKICVLNKSASSQAHTVSLGISKLKIKGPIFIKDCDNQFNHKIETGNYVTFLNLNNASLVLAKNKSYIENSKKNIILKIVEKKIISDSFCTGGYSFVSADQFCKIFEKIYDENKSFGEIYISHVIQSMILLNHKFKSKEILNYFDFGTFEEWKKFTERYISIVTEIDGIFFKKGSQYLKNKWSYETINKNMEALQKINDKKILNLTILTNRPDNHKSKIVKIFNKWGIKINNFIGNQPITNTIIIRDFNEKNTFGRSLSINIPSNSTEFTEYIKNITQ